MNSKDLKKKYNNVYEDFFKKNSLVISLPLLLNWSWDIFNNYKWLIIKQKIPLRVYLWINKTNTKKIEFRTINYHDFNDNKFIETDLKQYAPFLNDFSNYFNDFCSDKINKKWWVEISLLSEVSRWAGLWFISITWLLLQIWLQRIYNKVNYINSDDIKINDFLNTNTPLDCLFRSTLRLNKSLGNKLSVENQIVSFFDSYYPIVSFKENVWDNLQNMDIDSIKIYGYRLDTIEKNLSSVPFIPIDYGLIYSGRPVLVDHIVSTNDNSFKWTWEIKDKLKWYFWNTLDDILPIRKPEFYKTFVSEQWDIFKKVYWELMWAVSLEVLNLMIKLYSNGYTESNMKNFIDSINKIRYWNYITRKSAKTFTEFIDALQWNFIPWARIFWLAPNDTSVMWWAAIFALPLEWLRKDLLISIDKTKKEIPWVKLLYANWLDGIENKWFVLEQDLDSDIYSEFISKNSIILETNWEQSILIDNDYIENNILDWLTLDLVNRKMYLDWVKLTSKELHSQNTTIDILAILLEKFWEDISNKDLPKSSYSSNKNEMLWKIVLPLLKLIEKEKKIKLPFICKGSLSDFYLKIKDSDLKINIIKKLS